MSTDTVFAGPVPQLYDMHLGPILFQPYARRNRRTAEARRPRHPRNRRRNRHRHPRDGSCRARQPHRRHRPEPGHARHRRRRAAGGRRHLQQADAQALPFPDGSFDLVACSFGMMFMPDKQAAYGEALRVLRPGGRMIFTVWDRIETSPVMHRVEEAVAGLFPDNPPRFLSARPAAIATRPASSRIYTPPGSPASRSRRCRARRKWPPPTSPRWA